MLLVALTGNIASGKSTVARALSLRGALVVDSDVAAREAVAPGTPALAAIVRRFGEEMRQADGSLDRAALGRVVFSDTVAREALEAIVHPVVEAARALAVEQARAAGASIVICDIPLLFEARLAWHFPRILLVDAPKPVRIERLVRDRGMLPADAEARVRAQVPAALKRPRADLVLDNGGERAALQPQLAAGWARLARWASARS